MFASRALDVCKLQQVWEHLAALEHRMLSPYLGTRGRGAAAGAGNPGTHFGTEATPMGTPAADQVARVYPVPALPFSYRPFLREIARYPQLRAF